MKLFLGIDTSAYTTSLCVVDADGQVVGDVREVLTVPLGKQGLRQSEAVFQHIQNLPRLAGRIREQVGKHGVVAAIAATIAPRPQPGSYMPVFVPGSSFGEAYAHMAGVPFYQLSHQENHILSGIHTGGGPQSGRFLAVHLSGGTTELTEVAVAADGRMAVTVLGATGDLHAGQFVDRVGVALGLPFPAGPHVEKLALTSDCAVTVPAVHKNGQLSFSGPLTALLREVGKADPGAIALGCLECIVRALVKWVKWAESQVDCTELLLVGGVAANAIIRQMLAEKLSHWKLYFASPSYSTDNALGAALFARQAYNLDQRTGS